MREILFRGMRTYGKGWVEGDLSQDKMMNKSYIHYEYREAPSWGNPGGCDIVQTHEVIPETVGQFTGLLDKNGNRIFEGDVLRSINHYEGKNPYYIYHEVQWRERFHGWFAKNQNNGTEDTHGDIQLFVYIKDTVFEITGSIHETPSK